MLSHFIKKAYEKYDFISAYIYGPQGVGKTTYALKVMFEIYQDWDQVLNHTFLTTEALTSKLNEAVQNDERIPAILIDDAGLVFIKYMWYKDFSIWFSKLYNLIRTICAGVLFTSVEVSDIIKFIRDKVIYRVAIIKQEEKAKAIGYRVFTLPSLEQRVKLTFEDTFTLQLPQEVRDKYNQQRKEVIKNLMTDITKRTQKKPKEPALSKDEILKNIKI